MKKARYISVLFILILLSALMPLPQGQAIVPQDQTISIIDTHDDRFITEAGVGIDAWLCHILDPTMDIRSYLVFRGLEINWWEPLTNATLRFRTTVNLDFDNESAVTIYGMKFSNLQDEGIINPSFVLSVPYTSASVSVNTSQFYGQQWHEVNVTSIVEELIRSHVWDGDGRSGDETGDDIGFVIVGAEGYDTRWFIDYLYGTPSLASQLVIHWNHEVPPPSGYEDAVFNETYGNYTIWFLAGEGGYTLDPMEYVFRKGPNGFDWHYAYDDLHSAPGSPTIISDDIHTDYIRFHSQRKLVRTSDGVLHVVYQDTVGDWPVRYKKSADNGSSWTGAQQISVTGGEYAGIAVDSIDNLHVVWQNDVGANDQIHYRLYNASTTTWEDGLSISANGFQNWAPAIALDEADYIHVVWRGGGTGSENIWYVNYTTSWSAPMLISNATGMLEAGMQQNIPSIAVDSNNYLHIVWAGEVPDWEDDQFWYVNRTDSWSIPVNISIGMLTYVQFMGCIAIDSDDDLHVVWYGHSSDHLVNEQVWYLSRTTGWSEPLRISTYTGMDGFIQAEPSIAVASNDTIYVLWDGAGTGAYGIWSSEYETEWSTPEIVQSGDPDGAYDPNLRWARWPGEVGEGGFIIVDYNGTVIMDNGDPLIFNTTDDAQDWIDTEDPDPEDPDPPGWPETGYFTRFKMRLYYLIIGFGCLFGPLLFFAWRRPSGYYLLCGTILMLMGIGMLLSIGQV